MTWDGPERQLRDLNAVSGESSYVSYETYRRLAEIAAAAIYAARVTGTGPAGDPRTVAKIAVENMSASRLEDIVAGWLEGRGHVGAL